MKFSWRPWERGIEFKEHEVSYRNEASMMINFKNILKYVFPLTCLLFLVGVSLVFSGERKTDVIGKLKIANEYVTRLGYNVNKLTPLVSLHTVPWNDCFPEGSEENYYPQKRELLKGKIYWMIYYYDTNNFYNENIAVFIDAKTDEILTDYRGKSILYEEGVISAQEAIETANSEIKNLNYNLDDMLTSISYNKSPWNIYPVGEKYIVNSIVKDKTINYWAVYYFNPKNVTGGDVCVFINAKTKSIIGTYRGK
jgi:hypothetical protein